MTILPLDTTNQNLIAQIKALLTTTFACYSSEQDAQEEMDSILEAERICLVAVEGDKLLGFVGAMHQYSHAWELHPLAVDALYRKQGIGKALVLALEQLLVPQGVLTIYLGTDDEEFKTSLSQGNLFEDTYAKIAQIQNPGNHPYAFYQKCGYKIVGVIPDANGIGKPDIFMAKRIFE